MRMSTRASGRQGHRVGKGNALAYPPATGTPDEFYNLASFNYFANK